MSKKGFAVFYHVFDRDRKSGKLIKRPVMLPRTTLLENLDFARSFTLDLSKIGLYWEIRTEGGVVVERNENASI